MTREEFKHKAEAQLAAWEKTAEDLKAKLSEVGEDTRGTYEERIQAVRAKQDAVRVQLGELREAGDDAWDDLKNGCEAAWDDVEVAWTDVKTAVSAAVARLDEVDKKDGQR